MQRTRQVTLPSVAGAIPVRAHGLGVWGNRRVATGIRVDEKLYKQAKPIMMAYFGSTCKAIEAYLATLVATAAHKKLGGAIPEHTSIDIGSIVITRDVKTRRKLVLEEEREVTERVEVEGCVYCEMPSVTSGVFRDGKKYWLCAAHARQFKRDRRWRIQ